MENSVTLNPALEQWQIALIAGSALVWLACFMISRIVFQSHSKTYRQVSAGERVEWDS
jgi:hypothetical protein